MIKAYGVTQEGKDVAVPAVFIVDATGKIIWRHITDDFTVRPTVEEVLGRVPR